jgi:hypothetical protein
MNIIRLAAMLPFAASFTSTAFRNPLVVPTLRVSDPQVSGLSSSYDNRGSKTQLDMAFVTDQPSNMFEGPLSLTRERDACGVGFIVNTRSGGTPAINIKRKIYHEY